MKVDSILSKVAKVHSELTPGSNEEKSFLDHLSSLAKPAEYPKDYPESLTRPFPEEIKVAVAGCRCGHAEFIVDGSTQEWQHCGSIMFRYETATYHRKT